MKFTCDSKPLAYALTKCAYISRIDRTYAVARAVNIEAVADPIAPMLRLSATDMSTTVVFYVTDVDVIEAGEMLVDTAGFAAFVSANHASISAHTTKGGKLSINGGGNRILLNKLTGSFPDEMSLLDKPTATINGKALSDILSIGLIAK